MVKSTLDDSRRIFVNRLNLFAVLRLVAAFKAVTSQHTPKHRHALRFIFASVLICFISAGMIMAQDQKPSPSPQASAATAAQPTTPAANPADVASIDSIMLAVYDVISGPAGKKRDWNRMRSLFVPGARLVPTGARPGGQYGSRVLTVDEYIERSSPFLEKEGFYEREVARKTDAFGQIAHAFSTYESKHDPNDAKPFARGINSFQLMNDGKRWWIVTIFWQGE